MRSCISSISSSAPMNDLDSITISHQLILWATYCHSFDTSSGPRLMIPRSPVKYRTSPWCLCVYQENQLLEIRAISLDHRHWWLDVWFPVMRRLVSLMSIRTVRVIGSAHDSNIKSCFDSGKTFGLMGKLKYRYSTKMDRNQERTSPSEIGMRVLTEEASSTAIEQKTYIKKKKKRWASTDVRLVHKHRQRAPGCMAIQWILLVLWPLFPIRYMRNKAFRPSIEKYFCCINCTGRSSSPDQGGNSDKSIPNNFWVGWSNE